MNRLREFEVLASHMNDSHAPGGDPWPQQYLVVLDCAAGYARVIELSDDEPLDLESLVDRYLAREHYGEVVRNSPIGPCPSDYWAAIKLDGEIPDSVRCWASGYFRADYATT